MKIALCLHGYFDTISDANGGLNTGMQGFNHLYIVLNQFADVSVFAHCWQPQYEDVIRDYYNPVVLKLEPQIDFDTIAKENGLDQTYFDGGFQRENTLYSLATIPRILSFLYSRCQSLSYALEVEPDYDWYITCRFDISKRGGSEVNQLRFNYDNDRDYIYCAHFNQLNCGYPDMWFYGNKENMSKLATIYDKCFEYFKPNSNFEQLLTSGWPDSVAFDNMSVSDPRQFTNEVEKPVNERSDDLMKYPKWQCINSHIMHKYFFLDNNLYNKTRWI